MADVLIPIAILVVVYGALALIAWRRPFLGKLAMREAGRRPAQSVLLIAGMMFGTAAILGMQVGADTFTRITNDVIYANWGRVDITVTQGGQPFSQDVASSLAAAPEIAKGAAGVQGGYQLVTSTGEALSRWSTSALLIYVTVWLVTIGPAIRASRLPASEALRIVG